MINKRLQEMGLTPGKAILIAVLFLILLGVIASNLIESPDTQTSQSDLRRRRTPVTPVVKKVAATKQVERSSNEIAVRSWPVIELDRAMQHDPFQLPIPLRPNKVEIAEAPEQTSLDPAAEQAAARQKMLELRQLRKQKLEKIKAMQETGVAIALVTADERVIKIGNDKLYVGDLWEGFRIDEIRDDGSVVVKIE